MANGKKVPPPGRWKPGVGASNGHKQSTAPNDPGAPPPYDPARDRLMFDRAWEKVAQLKADGKLKLMPPRSTIEAPNNQGRKTKTRRGGVKKSNPAK